MPNHPPVVYLLDVDNTLLDSDRVIDDWRRQVSNEFCEDDQKRYWRVVEDLQKQLGYDDYLGALQQHRCEKPRDSHVLKLSLYLLNYPFAERLFPQALDVIAALKKHGAVTIVSDGDIVFQPRKIEASGLFAAVEGRVLVYIHKESDLHDVERHFPADHYVMIEDKPRVLTAAKRLWRDRVTTIFVRQGRHANDPQNVKPYPEPDLTLEQIGELLNPNYGPLFDQLACQKK
jgi:beta-phosphoglucomutase-like phosphatase (HAD superfamily)